MTGSEKPSREAEISWMFCFLQHHSLTHSLTHSLRFDSNRFNPTILCHCCMPCDRHYISNDNAPSGDFEMSSLLVQISQKIATSAKATNCLSEVKLPAHKSWRTTVANESSRS
jgi:hypothetical protein